ncbi:MAG: threonine/serine exporter family protein [Bacillus sp. (in: firmicutes)]
MEYIAQLITSFIGSAGFVVLFNAPKESLVKCGFVGMAGWICYYVLSDLGMNLIPATIIAATLITVISQSFARIYKTPMIIFIVGGIIPLVPGGTAYDAMRNFVENDYNTAVNLAAKAFLVSGSLAMGIVISEVLFQIYNRVLAKKRTI